VIPSAKSLQFSISLQFKILEQILGGQPMLNIPSEVWVTIDINRANFIFVAINRTYLLVASVRF
jgi:hypothetical protein